MTRTWPGSRIPGQTGSLFFLQDPVLGLALLGTLALQPVSALGGLFAAGTAYVYSHRLYPGRTSRLPEILNAGLWGLLLGWMLPLTPRFLLLAACGGVLVAGLTFLLAEGVYRLRGSAVVLCLPFTLAAILTAWLLPDALPVVGSTTASLPVRFFQSLSLVTFVPNVWAGVLLWLLLIRKSPWLAGMALTGFLAGWVGEGMVLNAGLPAPSLLSSLNYALVGMALGGGLIPVDRRTALRLSSGLALTVLLQLMFLRLLGTHSWITVTLSFHLVALSVFHGGRIGTLHPDWLDFRRSPEERHLNRNAQAARFPPAPVPLSAPVLGPWTVSQGENGPWSHQYDWKHAMDLVLTGADGCRHRGNPRDITSYFAWDKPVVAPANGIVEVGVGHLPDLPMGQVDTEHNWGNHVILRTPVGVRILMAHLKQGSLQVVEGQAVQTGDWIGACGNSGYSPEPHVHLHVQALPGAGAATIPFTVMSASLDGELGVPRMPRQEQILESRETDPSLIAAMSYPLGVNREAVSPDGSSYPFSVSMNSQGGFQFESKRGTLPFYRAFGLHTFLEPQGSDPFFQLLYQTLPSLPMYARIGDRWTDHVTMTSSSKWRVNPLIFFQSPSFPLVHLRRISRTRILCTGPEHECTLELSEDLGIQSIQTPEGNWTVRTLGMEQHENDIRDLTSRPTAELAQGGESE